ncbi:MAG: DEAD/DEAH box helicase [Phycisphaerales bacterium]
MDDIFQTKQTFADLGLRDDLLRGLHDLGFKHPTHIQAELIPVALAGRDVLGQAKTGTGKTAAFGLPLLQLIEPGEALAAMVLVPTRELAVQVTAELHELGRHRRIGAVTIYGGQAIKSQVQALRSGPGIIVGTPGRVMDMHKRGHLPYDRTRIAVLDEVDRMLDIGFRDDIRAILGGLPGKPQTIFVSATISPDIERLARSYMRDPAKIATTAKSLTVSQVKQSYLAVEPWDKTRLLVHLLTHESPALTVVFCRTKRTVDNVAKALQKAGIDAHAIHGDMYQRKRNQVMEKLRSGDLSVLVASDLASRGLDIDDITHVINFDLPEDPELYVHRIGRTARAGREGIAWAFVSPDQGELLTNIEVLINFEIPRMSYPDFKPGPLPSDVQARREAAQRRAEAPSINRGAKPVAPAPAVMAANPTAAAERFPGGLVPSASHTRTLGGRVASRRRR